MNIKQGEQELTPRAAEELRFAEAKLGVDAEKFLSTTLGKYLVGRAEIELQEAHRELESCKPEELLEIQNKAWRASSLINWLAEAIHNGSHAEYELKQNEVTDD